MSITNDYEWRMVTAKRTGLLSECDWNSNHSYISSTLCDLKLVNPIIWRGPINGSCWVLMCTDPALNTRAMLGKENFCPQGVCGSNRACPQGASQDDYYHASITWCLPSIMFIEQVLLCPGVGLQLSCAAIHGLGPFTMLSLQIGNMRHAGMCLNPTGHKWPSEAL